MEGHLAGRRPGDTRLTALLVAFSLALAALLGFAAHRASVCTVRAVVEVMSTRRGYLFASFVKAALWVAALLWPLHWLGAAAPAPASAGIWASIAGGFVFGLGAALNRGCAFATLARLADGDGWMLATLAGVGAGVLLAGGSGSVPPPAAGTAAPAGPAPWALAVLAVVWAAMCWEVLRLWRSRPQPRSWWRLPAERRYRLSTAALVMGAAGGLLYALHGSWAYTGTLGRAVASIAGRDLPPSVSAAALALALLGGMLLSAWQRGALRPRWRRGWGWLGNLVAGGFMGAGVVLVPGGNDALILSGLPSLAAHALPAYAAMLAAIACVLAAMRALTGRTETVDCAGDICRSETPAHRPTSDRVHRHPSWP